ncbi:YjiH family protein [Neisseria sp. Ec49-e6-T10]|uniref:YjiH family protein n=1 Tax=Neisseria sp. Ec49-e6-T10 TaxID=3140744 RepID=UPI003EB77438
MSNGERKEILQENFDLPLKFSAKAKAKIIFFSLFGFFTYFVSFKISETGSPTILVDHIANIVKDILGSTLVAWVCVAAMIAGAIQPFTNKTWNRSLTDSAFTFFKIAGIPIGIMYVLNQYYSIQLGPDALYTPGMIPFLFEKLAMSLTFVIPIGSALIIFLTDYGLMEFTGVFARPFMRPVYKTPGRSAIDAVASFVGSYSIALLITGKQYQTGFYSKKEAAIIATGFSTVSATFCVIVAKTLGLMEYWNLFFWSALLVTFIVTAITVRIWPLRSFSEEYNVQRMPEEPILKTGVTKRAIAEGLAAAEKSPPIIPNMLKNLLVGISVTVGLIPSIMSIGLLGLVLAQYTPVFDLLSYLFYPITWLLQFAEAQIVAKAVSMGIAEMFLPAALAKDLDLISKFVVGITCISEILFFSASIPCMVAMRIPISVKDMVIIWYERVVLTLLVATPFAWIMFKIFSINA